jgi:hypothetical protein
MKATIRIFSNKVTEKTVNVESESVARGLAKRALRNIPFHWVWARVIVPELGKVWTIRKGKDAWDQVEDDLKTAAWID